MKKIIAIMGIALIMCSLMIIPVGALYQGISIEPYIPLNISIMETTSRYTFDMPLTGVINEGKATTEEHISYGKDYEEWGYDSKDLDIVTNQEITKVTDAGYTGYVSKTITRYNSETGQYIYDLKVDRIYTYDTFIIDTNKGQYYSGVIKDVNWREHGTQKATYFVSFRYQKLINQTWQWVDDYIEKEINITDGNIYTVPIGITKELKNITGNRYVLCNWYEIRPSTDGKMFQGKVEGTIDYQCNFSSNGNSLRVNGFQQQYIEDYTSAIKTIEMESIDFSNFIVDGVGGFLTTPLIGNMSIGGILAVIIAIGLVVVLIKIYLGG